MGLTNDTRDEAVYMAKLAEQGERYDEMVEEMKKVAQMVHDQELSVEERNLLSVAYKNVIGARRASWRIISSIEQKEESKGNEEHVKRIKKYREVVENELSDICSSILGLLDEHLIPTASSGESKVFYLKMKGDYHRYLAEFKTGSDRKEAAEHTLQAYKAAQVRISDWSGSSQSRHGAERTDGVLFTYGYPGHREMRSVLAVKLCEGCRTSPWWIWHQPTLSGWDWPSTSPSSTTRS